ncbi:putative F-box/FBD/LRR-repeat protein at5g56810 [Phtheirospermum japonicum]|uniref:Putative F-box/FBD/LRR-repeat protein at5g56810 n=1 Tax=Phtheirospermum japonicum TaxID=374723 RepID=A0A830D568_9LAMI|nr:putative F-box/FBD/LRR-repeat protein at5g56810 [Phtheirospermum japonicum]
MRNHEKIEAAINGGLELPKRIIHRIQSFLNGKEAAQTTVLSKSWHTAWLTRPNVVLDENDFLRFGYQIDGFPDLAKKTLQRYEDTKLKIDSLRLCLCRHSAEFREPRVGTLSNELIVKALGMGITHLHVEVNWDIVLTREVFGAENLVGLSLDGCIIDLGMDPKVTFSSLESLSLEGVQIVDSDIISNIISNCPLIKKLSLSNICDLQNILMKFDPMFFRDLLSKFPSIEDFTLRSCINVQQVSSRSLRRLTFSEPWNSIKFDVPNIRKFMYDGSAIPSVSFKSTSTEWESHVSIYAQYNLSTLWFRRLNKFLTKLRRSKIHLSLNVKTNKSFDYESDDIQGLPKPEVENLTMDVGCLPSLSCYAIFDGLFLTCRPKLITQYLYPYCKKSNDFLWKTLARQMNGQFWTPSRSMYGLQDLKEVNVQLFDEEVSVWRDLPWESLLDATTSLEDMQRIRFQLKWKP